LKFFDDGDGGDDDDDDDDAGVDNEHNLSQHQLCSFKYLPWLVPLVA
jgi:hypothetical protein